MPAGRPTDYSEEKLKIAQEYLKTCWENEMVPYIERLAYLLEITSETIRDWIKTDKNKEFSLTIKRLEDLQRYFLLEKSGDKETFTPGQIFQLKANHGMIETERKMLVGKDGESLPILGGATNVQSNDGNSKAPEAK